MLNWIWAQDLLGMCKALYYCATTTAQNLIKTKTSVGKSIVTEWGVFSLFLLSVILPSGLGEALEPKSRIVEKDSVGIGIGVKWPRQIWKVSVTSQSLSDAD